MTLTEAIRSHRLYPHYLLARATNGDHAQGVDLLGQLAWDLRQQFGNSHDQRSIKQAIRNAARDQSKVKQGKGRPRKTYEVDCAHCGKPNVITLDRT